MATGFRSLLAAIAADPVRRLSDLPILSSEDRNRVLEWWSVGPEVTHADTGIHHRFEREAAATPDAPALVFGEGSLTYGELNRLANIVARHLIDRGVGPEAVVGLFLERWPLRLVGLLGVLKAGAAYLPLDPDHPTERLAAAFEDSRATVLLSEDPLRDRLASFGPAGVVLLDRLVDSSTPDDPGNPGVTVDGDNLAYVIFTSGTTGRPKGVMVHHRALLAIATAWERLYDLRGATRRHLQAAPFAFDVFTGDWVRALTTGGTLVACPRDVLARPGPVGSASSGATGSTPRDRPGAGRAAGRAPRGRAHPPAPPPAGDRLRHPALRAAPPPAPPPALDPRGQLLRPDRGGHRQHLLRPRARHALPASDAPAPIGRPLPGVRAYVLDRRLGPVPPGVVGELFIGGSGVARGYAGDPARRPSGSSPTRSAPRARGCTPPATAPGGATAACWSSWAAATAR